jgi:hypothetical protein
MNFLSAIILVRYELSSLARTLFVLLSYLVSVEFVYCEGRFCYVFGSNPTSGIIVWCVRVCLFCVCVVLCVGRGLATL